MAGEAGFTLIEVMISIALFSLIALAGFTLLDSELRVQARTDGRMERLGDLQRAMFLLTSDFQQMSSPIEVEGGAIAFRRFSAGPAGGDIGVRYSLRDGGMRRTLVGVGEQTLLADISALHWSFYVDGKGWQDTWPAPGAQAPRPSAVAVDISLKGAEGESGVLRRLVALPAPA